MTMDKLIECCDDKNYAAFLEFIKNQCPNVSNIGTVLSKVPQYENFEQLFSAGLKDIINTNLFDKTINDIPKSLIKVAKDKEIKISNRFCDYWKENINGHCLAYNMEYISLSDKDVYNILSVERYDGDVSLSYYSLFNKLQSEYGYTAKALLLYIDQLKTFEAIDNVSYAMVEIYDYARMMNEISPKFDKYPRHFLTTHKIACRNYNRLKKEFSEELFRKRIDRGLEFSYKDYQFIYPNSIEEIKNEAVQQNNCVASYIDYVLDGKCHILFLRKKDNLNESLVTIEVRENKIVQARRRFNDPVTKEEQVAIDKWNENFSKIRRKQVA